jgi:hypothetical protein
VDHATEQRYLALVAENETLTLELERLLDEDAVRCMGDTWSMSWDKLFQTRRQQINERREEIRVALLTFLSDEA